MRESTVNEAHADQLKVLGSSTMTDHTSPEATSSQSVSSRVAQQLREDIYAGRLAQGDALREVALAETHDVSRRTIREALLQLAAERLVEHERNRGATVRTLVREDVVDLYEVRRTLELQGARNAAFATGKQRQRLRDSYERLSNAAFGEDSREMVRCDLAFHGAVVGMSGSPRLNAFYEQISPEMEMALSVIRGGESDDGLDAEGVIGDHRTIHDALIARDVIEAQRAILGHIEYNERYLLRLIS